MTTPSAIATTTSNTIAFPNAPARSLSSTVPLAIGENQTRRVDDNIIGYDQVEPTGRLSSVAKDSPFDQVDGVEAMFPVDRHRRSVDADILVVVCGVACADGD